MEADIETLSNEDIQHLKRYKPFLRKHLDETWIECIERNLKKRNFITRNECLQNYQTKLASYMSILKKNGWKVTALRSPYGSFKRGVDFVYWLEKVGRSNG